MKFLAYMIKGGKELARFSVFLFACLIVEMFVVYVSYVSAVNAHIPLKNLNLFMKNGYLLVGMVAFLSIWVLIFFYLEIYRKKIMVHGIFLSVFFFAEGVYKGDTFNLIVENYDNEVNSIMTVFFISVLIFVACSLVNRVIGNYFFRQLFSKEFQEKCNVTIDEENLIYSIGWIRTIATGFKRLFRNYRFTTVKQEDYEKDEPIDPLFVGKESYVYEPKKIDFFVSRQVIQFKGVPYTFEFEPHRYLMASSVEETTSS